jgi:hypothetical protein
VTQIDLALGDRWRCLSDVDDWGQAGHAMSRRFDCRSPRSRSDFLVVSFGAVAGHQTLKCGDAAFRNFQAFLDAQF